MNTKDKGNTTEAMILAALVRAGRRVLVPWGDNLRYDLAYDDAGKLVRVQCKTGHLSRGAVVFRSASSYAHRNNRPAKTYYGEADLFGIYCAELNACYLVPVEECGCSEVALRIDVPRNRQGKRIRWAADYQLVA